VPLFLLEVFLLSPWCFGGASFFIKGLSFLVNERRLRQCAFGRGFGLAGVTTFAECGASFASNFDGDD
jgi:hypothetical protein